MPIKLVNIAPQTVSAQNMGAQSIPVHSVSEAEIAVTSAMDLTVNSCEDYVDPYEIIPATSPQTMQTANKRMAENADIHAIPYYEVSNDSGGKTVSIGNTLE